MVYRNVLRELQTHVSAYLRSGKSRLSPEGLAFAEEKLSKLEPRLARHYLKAFNAIGEATPRGLEAPFPCVLALARLAYHSRNRLFLDFLHKANKYENPKVQKIAARTLTRVHTKPLQQKIGFSEIAKNIDGEHVPFLRQQLNARVENAVSRLLKANTIRRVVEQNTALKHVLQYGVLNGSIPETNGESKAKQMLDQARLAGKVSAELLEDRPKTSPGRPTQTAASVQEALKEGSAKHVQARALVDDTTFSSYLKNMALILHARGYNAEELRENQGLMHAILDHVTTEYQLMKDVTVPNSIIKTQGHKLTAFQAHETYRDVDREFGKDPELEPIKRTAAVMLLQKLFKNAKEASESFAEKLKEERDRARKIQLGDLELPYLNGLARDEALDRLQPLIAIIGKNFKDSALGRADAEQTARLEALELLEAGERDAEIIVNAMITKTTKEAAAYSAFRKITVEMPENF